MAGTLDSGTGRYGHQGVPASRPAAGNAIRRDRQRRACITWSRGNIRCWGAPQGAC